MNNAYLAALLREFKKECGGLASAETTQAGGHQALGTYMIGQVRPTVEALARILAETAPPGEDERAEVVAAMLEVQTEHPHSGTIQQSCQKILNAMDCSPIPGYQTVGRIPIVAN